MRFRAICRDFMNDVAILSYRPDADDKMRCIAKPVVLEFAERDLGTPIGEPTWQLHIDEARSLMTALWEAGVRPNGVSDKSEVLNAMKEHLEDLRRVAFK